MPPVAEVSDDEPILTTTRRAATTSGRSSVTGRRPRPTGSASGSWAEPISYDVGPVRSWGWSSRRATSARVSVSLRSAMPLLDVAAAASRRPLLGEAMVLAATGEVLGAGVEPGLEVEDDGVVGVPDEHQVALDRAHPHQAGLDAQAVEPVGEEAHRLVVGEVGLPHPALGLGAAHPPPVAGLGHGELVGAVDRARPDHDARRLDLGLRRPGGLDDLGHGEGELAQPVARGRGDGEHVEPAATEVLDDHLGDVAAVGHVDLVQGDQARAVVEAAVPGQLVLDHVEVVGGVAARLDGRGVDDVHDRRAPLDVTQEVVAEAAPVGGTLDQAGHVRDGEGRVARADHPEVGHERREGVVGDLGPGAGDRGDQAGLAGAREAHEADVGDHLQLEADVELVAGLAEEGEPGGLALGAGQRGVAEPAATALGDDELAAGAHHVGEHLAVGGHHDRAVGDGQHQVGAVPAVLVVTRTVAAVLGLAPRAVVVVDERRDVGVDPQDHRAARAAVATVGATQRLELLAVHRGDTVAAAARRDVQRHPVDEGRDGHRCLLSSAAGWVPSRDGRSGRAASELSRALLNHVRPCVRRRRSQPTGTMLTTLRPRRVPNSTAPPTSANRVSSPPRPTPEPGWKWVPTLADDDLAGVDDLAAVALHTETLGVGVATVLGRRRALLVCHLFSPSQTCEPRCAGSLTGRCR